MCLEAHSRAVSREAPHQCRPSGRRSLVAIAHHPSTPARQRLEAATLSSRHQDSISIGDASRPRFSAIRFSITGAASPHLLQMSALLRRAADRKTLWIRRVQVIGRPVLRPEPARSSEPSAFLTAAAILLAITALACIVPAGGERHGRVGKWTTGQRIGRTSRGVQMRMVPAGIRLSRTGSAIALAPTGQFPGRPVCLPTSFTSQVSPARILLGCSHSQSRSPELSISSAGNLQAEESPERKVAVCHGPSTREWRLCIEAPLRRATSLDPGCSPHHLVSAHREPRTDNLSPAQRDVIDRRQAAEDDRSGRACCYCAGPEPEGDHLVTLRRLGFRFSRHAYSQRPDSCREPGVSEAVDEEDYQPGRLQAAVHALSQQHGGGASLHGHKCNESYYELRPSRHQLHDHGGDYRRRSLFPLDRRTDRDRGGESQRQRRTRHRGDSRRQLQLERDYSDPSSPCATSPRYLGYVSGCRPLRNISDAHGRPLRHDPGHGHPKFQRRRRTACHLERCEHHGAGARRRDYWPRHG